jgi:hypothetical protein
MAQDVSGRLRIPFAGQHLYYGDVRRVEVLALLIDEVLVDSYKFLCKVFMFYFVRLGTLLGSIFLLDVG